MPTTTRKVRRDGHFTEASLKEYLTAELAKGRDEFTAGSNGGRAGMIMQLELSIHVLRLILGSGAAGLLMPLSNLAAGLLALDGGHTQGFLEPISQPHRPKTSNLRGAMQGCLAATYKVLVREGMTHIDAIKAIEKRVAPYQFVKKGQIGLTLRTIRQWQTLANKKPNSPLGKTYHRVVALDLGGRKESPSDAALLLLETLLKNTRAGGIA